MALTQITSEGIKDDEVKTADILNANVTQAKLATDAVSTVKIVNQAVTNAKLADESVSTVKIGDGQVTEAKLATDAITTTKIADDAVTSALIADNAVLTAAINADAVTGAKIADDAVGSEHIEVLDAALQFGDSVKAQLGTGNDLEIYHNGSSSYIDNVNNHELIVRAGTGTAWFQGDIVNLSTEGGTETYLKATKDGAVELYYNNVKNFETVESGAQLKRPSGGATTFDVIGPEGEDAIINLNADDGDDAADRYRLRTKTNGDFAVENYRNGSGWETNLTCTGDGAVDLYYDNAKKAYTQANGLSIETGNGLFLADNGKVFLGTGNDLQIYFDGTNSYIKEPNSVAGQLIIDGYNGTDIRRGSDGANMIRAIGGGAVELYHNNTKTFATTSAGVEIRGGEGASADLWFSADEGDDNNDKWIQYASTGGEMHFKSYAAGSWEDCLKLIGNGAVELYYDNAKKLETTDSGVLSPGFYVTALNGDNLITNASQGGGSATCYIGNAAIQVSSDQRIKKDIVNTTLDATTKLKQVRVVDFKWDDPSDKAQVNRNSRGTWTGCLAQEMVNIFPHVVNAPRKEDNSLDNESERTWGLEYQHLVPALIKGFQEQQVEIDTLKTEKTKLQTDLTALTARVAALEAG
tara:strand:+ start:914 stop:2827 length:1914 start_codon:yes stop_codon:yes gene_type:complete